MKDTTPGKWQQLKRFLYPHVPWRSVGRILGLALIGALIAGCYGILHDQITYTLSPEYFTKFKFGQFHYADFRMGDRVFAGTIGFLATWWIGAMAGWIYGRLSLRPGEYLPKSKLVIRCFFIMLGISALFGLIGFAYGTITFEKSKQTWAEWTNLYIIKDLSAFARVGHIHNMGYLGGAVGSIIAGFWLRKQLD